MMIPSRTGVAGLIATVAAAIMSACSGASSDDDTLFRKVPDASTSDVAQPDGGEDVRVGRRDAGEGGASQDPPRAHPSAAGIDLGLFDCGSQTPRTKGMTLTNVGGAPLSYALALTGPSVFSIDGPRSGTIEPGANASISVTLSALPSNAMAGVPIRATLAISTSDLLMPKLDVPVTVTPSGGALAFSPPTASFGSVPLNTQATDIPVALTNAGNAAITLTLAQPGDAHFGLTWTGAPSTVTLAPGAKVPGLAARFRPTSVATTTTSTTPAVSGPYCGAVPALWLTGRGSTGPIGVSPEDVYFGTAGRVDCGTTAGSKTVTITNGGSGSFDFDAALALGANSPYTVAPASGTVGPNASVDLTVTPKPIPAQSLTTEDLYADTLTVSTVGTALAPFQVHLHETARGARLSFDTSTLAFGGVTANTTKNLGLHVRNQGNALARVTWVNGNARFTETPASPFSAAAGAEVDATVTFAPGLDNTPQTDTLTITTPDVLCAPLPGGVALSGTGLLGVASLSASSIDFNLVDCGSQAPAQTFTIKNDGNAPFDFSIALGQESLLYAASPSGGTLAPNASSVITVTPKPIPATSAITPNLYGDTLTVTTNIPNDTPRNVSLLQTARGVILNTPASVDFGPVSVGSSSSSSINLTNSGNAAGSVTISTTDLVVFAPSPTSGSVTGSGGQLGVNLLFTPGAAQPYSGTATFQVTGAAVCSPLPSVGLSGTGQ
jgi:hypothetical protein